MKAAALAALLLVERARIATSRAFVWALYAWIIVGWLLIVPLGFYLLTSPPNSPRPWAPLELPIEATR